MSHHVPAILLLRLAGLIALAAAGVALAQSAVPTAAAAPRSFLDVLVRGAEIPGAIILLMSVVAVALVIDHFRSVRESTMVDPAEVNALRELIETRRLCDAVAACEGRASFFATVVLAGLRHAPRGIEAVLDAGQNAADLAAAKLMRRAEYLHILGNLGPLTGLLGTVLGMIRAFTTMQATAGGYRPEDLAGGIGLALVNTFLGLVLAIVALGFFGVARSRIDALSTAATAAAIELLESLRPVHAGNVSAAASLPKVQPDAVLKTPPPASNSGAGAPRPTGRSD